MISSNIDIIEFIDINPEFENNIINRAKTQINLNNLLNLINKTFLNLSNYFSNIFNEINQLIEGINNLNLNFPFINLLTDFSRMFETLGKQFVNQSNMSLQIVQSVLIPNIEKHLNSYNNSNNSFHKIIETYSNIDKKSSYEDINNIEESIIKSSTLRSGSLYSLLKSIEITESCTFSSISLSFSQFLSLSMELMKKYLNSNQDILEESLKMGNNLKNQIKKSISQNLEVPIENIASISAPEFWKMRFSNHYSIHEALSKPSGLVWLGFSHSFRPNTWIKKYLTFNDGNLIAKDFNLIEKDLKWNLPLITVTPIEKNRRFTFKIQSPKELIEFQSLSQFDLEEWINLFTQHNFKILGHSDKINGKKCSDCNNNDATWISVNWASTLCLKCSGVHRMLSSSSSKVRSISLDNLHPYVFEMFEKIGYDTINKFLLSKPHKEKIDNRTEETIRQIYITRKYIFKEWANINLNDPFEAIQARDIKALYYSIHSNDKNINLTDESLTPLHAACSLGDYISVTFLSYCVNDLNIKDDNGWTPLYYSVFFNHIGIVDFLLQLGAQITNEIKTIAIYTQNKEMMLKISKKIEPLPKNWKKIQPFTLKYSPPNTPFNYSLPCL